MMREPVVMNIYVQIKQQMPMLSANEKRIGKYILEHPEQTIACTANRLAEMLFVSKSAVYRFCDKLKLAGFSELKRRLSVDLSAHLQERGFDFDFPVREGETTYEMLTSLREDYRKTVDTTLDYMQTSQLNLATAAMRRAKQIDVYASAGNIFFAENFAFQMQEIGVSVRVPVDEYHQRLVASASDKSHMAILITFEGRGVVAKTIHSILHRNDVPTLLVCSPNMRGLEGTYTIYISPHEHHADKVSSFSTRLSLLYVLDALYANYFSTDYENNLKKKRKYYQQMALEGEGR